ncbi:protein abrupt [Anthonomus grandis grandis]|uniref:protein abrupt n=1 Tax=Anthonomus grandis grandis TaxID=2921223 RepID=UPI00216647FC|nr:protein abrupt [Anthonomus grandis grandis]
MLAQYRSFSPFIMHTTDLFMMTDQQQFVLKWHYHETTLIQNLPFLLENDVLSDVTISVGAQHVRAHKIILAMCSVYFLQLFQEMKNTQHPVVVLHNASIEDVRAMLAFIYRGQCVVSKDQLPNLLSVAKLLKIQGLCDMKVPEKSIQAESIPLPKQDVSDEREREFENFSEAHTEPENSSYKPSCINIRRHSGGGGYSTAINLSIDSKRLRFSSSPTWGKASRAPSENTSPCSTEDTIPPFPTATITKPNIKQSTSPKESSETCKCFLCGKYLSNQYNLRVHMETHEEAYHACHACPHVSRSRDALRKHVSYRHPEQYVARKRKKTECS